MGVNLAEGCGAVNDTESVARETRESDVSLVCLVCLVCLDETSPTR
jgi:hypothetical protein